MKELIGQRETGDDPPRGRINSSQIPTRAVGTWQADRVKIAHLNYETRVSTGVDWDPCR